MILHASSGDNRFTVCKHDSKSCVPSYRYQSSNSVSKEHFQFQDIPISSSSASTSFAFLSFLSPSPSSVIGPNSLSHFNTSNPTKKQASQPQLCLFKSATKARASSHGQPTFSCAKQAKSSLSLPSMSSLLLSTSSVSQDPSS